MSIHVRADVRPPARDAASFWMACRMQSPRISGSPRVHEVMVMGTSLLWQTDSQLHDSVQRELASAPAVDTTDVAVTTRESVVTLTGFVDSYWQKYAVEAAVKRVRGVRAVANDVHIRRPQERTDPEIAHDAVLALKGGPTVMVTVRDGLLTLEGCVQGNDQRADAESAVSHLEGVKGVSNAILIEPVPSVGKVAASIGR